MQTIGDRLDTFFDSIEDEEAQTYSNYWETVKPKNETEIFQRYLFAFMSVHTTWKMNCLGYNGVKDFKEWGGNREILRGKIYKARVGMHNNRANYILRYRDALSERCRSRLHGCSFVSLVWFGTKASPQILSHDRA